MSRWEPLILWTSSLKKKTIRLKWIIHWTSYTPRPPPLPPLPPLAELLCASVGSHYRHTHTHRAMAENAGLENHRIKSFKNKGRDVEVSPPDTLDSGLSPPVRFPSPECLWFWYYGVGSERVFVDPVRASCGAGAAYIEASLNTHFPSIFTS